MQCPMCREQSFKLPDLKSTELCVECEARCFIEFYKACKKDGKPLNQLIKGDKYRFTNG